MTVFVAYQVRDKIIALVNLENRMPRTLDEIIEGDARYHEENPDAL